jgi:hypothetical protein
MLCWKNLPRVEVMQIGAVGEVCVGAEEVIMSCDWTSR